MIAQLVYFMIFVFIEKCWKRLGTLFQKKKKTHLKIVVYTKGDMNKMGFLKKCDICGKAYEPYNVQKRDCGPNGFAFMNIPNWVTTPQGSSARKIIDCCPEHMEKISTFVANLYEEANKPLVPPVEGGTNDISRITQ